MKAPRLKRLQAMIDCNNVDGLYALTWGRGACACLGARDGEPFCSCKMDMKLVGERISLFALKNHRLVRLKPKSNATHKPKENL